MTILWQKLLNWKDIRTEIFLFIFFFFWQNEKHAYMQSAFKIGVLCSNSPLYNHFNISSVKSKIIIHNMSLLCQRFVQKEFRIFMKIESHVYRNEICLTALFIPSCANAFKPNHSKWWRITSKITKGKKYTINPIGKKMVFFRKATHIKKQVQQQE